MKKSFTKDRGGGWLICSLRIIEIKAINIVFIIDIVEPNGFKGLTYYVSRRGGVGGMANADHCWRMGGGFWSFSYSYSEI